MKRLWYILPMLLGSLIFIGGTTYEDILPILVSDWSGLDSDELIGSDLAHPVDMMNFLVKSDGNQRYIEQRDGFHKVLPACPESTPNNGIHAASIIQIPGDTERVFIAGGDGKFYVTVGNIGSSMSWRALVTGGDAVAGGSILVFKDTILATGQDSIYIFAGKPPAYVEAYPWPYPKIILHQDRVYGFGYDDSVSSRIHWRPEFDIVFDSVDTKVNSGYAFISRNDGDVITNALSVGEHIACYKTGAIYKLLISPVTNTPVEVVLVSQNVGAYGYDALTEYNGVQYFVAEDGVYSFNGASVQKISEAIDYWFADSLVHSGGRAKVFKLAVVDGQLFVTLPLKSLSAQAQVADYRTFIYDFDLNVWTKHKLSTVDPDDGRAESQFMLRYEYSDACSAWLFGGNSSKYFKPRLLFVRDSSNGPTSPNERDAFYLYPIGIQQDSLWGDNGATTESYYRSPLVPVGGLLDRKGVRKVHLYGDAFGTCTTYVRWYGDAGTVIDSTPFSLTSTPTLFTKPVDGGRVQGSILGYDIIVRDTLKAKINLMQIDTYTKGPG